MVSPIAHSEISTPRPDLTICSICAVNPKNGRPSGMIAKETYEIIKANAAVLDSAVIYDRDFAYVSSPVQLGPRPALPPRPPR